MCSSDLTTRTAIVEYSVLIGNWRKNIIFFWILPAIEVEDVEAEDGTITVYTEPTDLHKALEALRANGQEEFQVTELEMIPQTEVTLEGEDLEVFEGLIDALEADDDVQKVYHNVADM